jgi:hypothetical protein
MPIKHDDKGNVIFLAAKAPGQVAPQNTSGAVAYRGARSGNNAFDPASGRFTSKGTRKLKDAAIVNENPVPVTRSGIPQGVTPEEWERRLDTVRLAARQFAQMDANAAQSFLKDRVTDLSKVDIQQFLTDVRAHQLDDLLDVFDAQLRKGKGVKVTASQTWMNQVFRNLTPDELSAVAARLVSRGFSTKQIGQSLVSRVKDDQTKQSLASQLGIKLEDTLDDDDFAGFEFNDTEPEPQPDPMLALADSIRELAQRPQEAPVINVPPAEVRLEFPQPTPKRIVRDPDTNEIVGVEPA